MTGTLIITESLDIYKEILADFGIEDKDSVYLHSNIDIHDLILKLRGSKFYRVIHTHNLNAMEKATLSMYLSKNVSYTSYKNFKIQRVLNGL